MVVRLQTQILFSLVFFFLSFLVFCCSFESNETKRKKKIGKMKDEKGKEEKKKKRNRTKLTESSVRS